MGLHTCLEEIEGGRTVAVGCHFLTTGVVDLRHLAHEWHNVAEELHKATNAHVLACTYAEDGEDAASNQTLADTLAELILRETL